VCAETYGRAGETADIAVMEWRRGAGRRDGAIQAEMVGGADKVQISVAEPDSKVIRFNLLQQQDSNKFSLHYL